MFKNNHNRAYATAVIVGIVILVAIIINGNYDVSVESEKINKIIPVESIESSLDDIYEEIPFESFENTFDEISEAIPVKIEPKAGIVESKSENVLTQNHPPVTLKIGGKLTDFTINRVSVVDKQYYKIINVNMLMSIHDLKVQDRITFQPTFDWSMKSPSGETYTEKCHGKGFDLMTITGKQNPNITWDICYHVDKEVGNFDLMYKKSKIGSITLD